MPNYISNIRKSCIPTAMINLNKNKSEAIKDSKEGRDSDSKDSRGDSKDGKDIKCSKEKVSVYLT